MLFTKVIFNPYSFLLNSNPSGRYTAAFSSKISYVNLIGFAAIVAMPAVFYSYLKGD